MKKDWLQIFTAILVLGLLFCGTASADPVISGDISPSNSTVVNGVVGTTQQFTIPFNESTSVTWTENGTSTTLPTGEGNISTLSHVFQSGSYQVTASIDGVGQIAAWDVEGTDPEETDYLRLEVLSPEPNFTVIQGTPELISVKITNSSGNPVQSSGFNYIRANFSNVDPELDLFDDGTHGDTSAGDGTFSNQWTPANVSTGESLTPCTLRISANHESLGFAEKDIIGSISRKPEYPDLVIEEISWDPASPYENENITIRVTFANSGSEPSEACTVKCYIGGNEVHSDSLSGLEAGSNASVTFIWVSTASGSMDIKAAVDTENKVSESNEGNNEKTITFNVNSADSDSSFTSDSSTSGGGGGRSSSGSSGGGAGGSPEPASNVRIKELSQQYIFSGKHVTFTFPKNATCVTYVAFDSKRTAGKTTTIVEMLKNKSTLVTELPSGKVYENVNIWVGNKGTASPENIENAVLGFRVEKNWTSSNDVNSTLIKLWRFSDKKWGELSTRQSGEDDRYIYFEAQTPGFSPFAIIAPPGENETVENASETSVLQSIKDSDIMGALFGELPGKQNSGSPNTSTMAVNESSSDQEASSIAGEAGERITGRGVIKILAVIALLSVTGFLGFLILKKQD